MTSKSLRAWRASFTRRWHQNPDLCDTVDPISGHQGRVALLLLTLFPNASRELIIAAVTHDQGEQASGDLAFDTKADLGPLYAPLRDVEHRERDAQGFVPNIANCETRILKLCDRLDAWLWMMRHHPGLDDRPDWSRQREEMVQVAIDLDVDEPVMELIRAMREIVGC